MNQSQLGPTIARYGLFGGLILSVVFLISSITGLNAGGSQVAGIMMGLLSFGICIVLVVAAIKKQRDEMQDGHITLGQCVLLGTGILVLAGLISTVVSLIYTNFIDPGYMERVIAAAEEKWEAAGMSQEQIEKAKSMTMSFKNPILSSATSMACYGIGGAIVSLIVGLIMKKEKPEFS
ncbi:MAG: DUF4199 domain-containing protein [Saprospiraceae bacterium]